MTNAIEKIQRRAMRNAAADVLARFDPTDMPHGDSPIEQILFAALDAEIRFGGHLFMSLWAPPKGQHFEKSKLETLGAADLPLIVESQIEIGRYRVDFLVRVESLIGSCFLVVECDGHDFHERTKEQASRDRARDRKLQSLGYPVFRFTGSEIWRDPCRCADQIIEWAEAQV